MRSPWAFMVGCWGCGRGAAGGGRLDGGWGGGKVRALEGVVMAGELEVGVDDFQGYRR